MNTCTRGGSITSSSDSTIMLLVPLFFFCLIQLQCTPFDLSFSFEKKNKKDHVWLNFSNKDYGWRNSFRHRSEKSQGRMTMPFLSSFCYQWCRITITLIRSFQHQLNDPFPTFSNQLSRWLLLGWAMLDLFCMLTISCLMMHCVNFTIISLQKRAGPFLELCSSCRSPHTVITGIMVPIFFLLTTV